MKVLIIKNISREGPGILLQLLDQYLIKYDLTDISRNEIIPDPISYNAMFVFGGPSSANDTTQRMTDELAKIKTAVNSHIPYFGFCLGMQTLVKAIGGKVLKNPIPEIGWKDNNDKYYSIDLTPAGMKDALFSGLASPLPIFQLHGETVELTSNMKILATGKHCKTQVIKVGEKAYGTQGHPELTDEMFELWLSEDDDLKKLDKYKLRSDWHRIRIEYETNGKQLLTNFLKIANLVSI